MAENTRAKGGMGEAAAKKYLESCGYKILETNFKTVFGEADIIAEKDGVIVFCEIKSRASAAFGLPAEAVGISKQQGYIKIAQSYISCRRAAGRDIRFDVIEILDGQINHIENAFQKR